MVETRMALEVGTKQKAIREAHLLLQKYGWSGFSFQDLAEVLGIKKPSLYAHFDSKEALGIDVVDNYRVSFSNWVETLSEMDPDQRLSAFFDMFYKFSQKGALYCPLSSFAAELHSLPPAMKKKLKHTYDMQTAWLRKIMVDGQAQDMFRKDISADELVDYTISIAIGSLFTARITSDPEKIKSMKSKVLLFLKSGALP
ncbi:MAG: TetR/AcrR family transcriptional regulator [Proteobacteria bacterium]|nr:MAG: TetR/AcrR family transcriptional regulator [Pseudomonadota bacterium]